MHIRPKSKNANRDLQASGADEIRQPHRKKPNARWTSASTALRVLTGGRGAERRAPHTLRGGHEKTDNYSLPQWEKQDFIKMEDFNDAFGKTDAALKANADATATGLRAETAARGTNRRGAKPR